LADLAQLGREPGLAVAAGVEAGIRRTGVRVRRRAGDADACRHGDGDSCESM
jgi:hypothetical protein